MQGPKLSIIVPIYNVGAYVGKCIESIINQTYRNLEIILVNDGSTDDGGLISDEYSKKDDRIIICHQENQGLSMARNNGISVSSGDYLGLVDGDDWIEKEMYETLFKNIDEYDADISTCAESRVDKTGKIIQFIPSVKIEHDGTEEIKLFENDKIMETFLLDERPYKIGDGATNKLYKRHIFENIYFPKGKVYEDSHIMHLLIGRAKRLVMTNNSYYNYLNREGSITQEPFSLRAFDYMEANEQRYDFVVKNYPHLEEVCRRLYFKVIIMIFLKIKDNSDIKKYHEQISNIIDKIKQMDIYTCGLPKDLIKSLELFTKDIRAGFVGMKYFKFMNGMTIN